MLPKTSDGGILKIKSILACKQVEGGRRTFHVEWETSWEDEEFLKENCADLLSNFLNNNSQTSEAVAEAGNDGKESKVPEKTNGNSKAEETSTPVSKLLDEKAKTKQSKLKTLDDIFAPTSDESDEDVSQGEADKLDFLKPKVRTSGGINDIVSRLQKNKTGGSSSLVTGKPVSEPSIGEDASSSMIAATPDHVSPKPMHYTEKPPPPFPEHRASRHPPDYDSYRESVHRPDYRHAREHIPRPRSMEHVTHIPRDRSHSPRDRRTHEEYLRMEHRPRDHSSREYYTREHIPFERGDRRDQRDLYDIRAEPYDHRDAYGRHERYDRRSDHMEARERMDSIPRSEAYARESYHPFEGYKAKMAASPTEPAEASEAPHVGGAKASSISPPPHASQISPPLPPHSHSSRSSVSSLKSLKTNVDNIGKLFPDHATLALQGRLDGAYYEARGKESPAMMPPHFQPAVILKCAICSDIFYEDVKFKQHMDMHEQVNLLKKEPPKLLKPGTYECKFCRAIFDDKDKLKAHYSEDHEQEYVHTQPIDQLYQCSLCEKTFVDYNKLVQHHQTHQQAGHRDVFIVPKKSDSEPSSPQLVPGVHVPQTIAIDSDGRPIPAPDVLMPASSPSMYRASSPELGSLSPTGSTRSGASMVPGRSMHYHTPSQDGSYHFLSRSSPVGPERPRSGSPVSHDSPPPPSAGDVKMESDSPLQSAHADSEASMTTLDFKPVNDALLNKKIEAGGESESVSPTTTATSDGKKMFRCNLCDELFPSEEERAKHSLLHMNRSTSLSCHICGKQFRHRTNLTTHLIVHSGVKPHQCHICMRRFTQKVNLQRHMHIHDGNRPFSCGMCNKSFTQKANLQRHIMSHTEHPQEELLAALNNIPNESEVNSAIGDGMNDVPPDGSPPPSSHGESADNRGVEFRCDICDKTFAQKVNLQKHMTIHSGQRPFQCYVCGKSFRQKSSLQKHHTIHTHGSTSFNCQTCHRLFMSKTNLQRHMLVHVMAGSTQCYLCDQKFSTCDNLERHFSEHIEEASPATALPQKYFDQITPGQTFRCAPCGIVFDSPMIFSQHLQCHRRGFSPEEGTHPGDMAKAYEENQLCPLQCNACGQIFMSVAKLDQHMLTHRHDALSDVVGANSPRTPDSVLGPDDVIYPRMRPPSLASSERSVKSEPMKMESPDLSPRTLKSESGTPTTRVSRCPVCKEKFPSKHEMRLHFTALHMNEMKHEDDGNIKHERHPPPYEPMPIPLSTEGIPLNSVADLPVLPNENSTFVSEDEERMIRENEEFIKDNILGGSEEYESKSRYERGSYSCKICNRVLTYKYSLEKHMLLHTGSFPHKCTLCSKRFNHKANLDKHMVVHSGAKPYVCHICSRPFSQKSNLQRHQLTHTQNRDFICEVCGKRFNHMASLKTHSLIHTGAKPFSCYICTKRFNQKGNLKRHIQTHKTGKRNRIANLARDHAGMDDQAIEKYHEQMGEDQMRMLLDEFDSSKVPITNDEEPPSPPQPTPPPPTEEKKLKKKRKSKRSEFDFSDEPLPTMISDDFEKIQDENTRELENGEILPVVKDEHEDGILTVLPSDVSTEATPMTPSNSELDISIPGDDSKPDTFKCDLCGKLFISSASLEVHRRSSHSEILCDICGKHFSQKANLLKHKLIHANKKPFTCRVCSKAFRQKANLQRHELIHDKERKAVNCEKCGKTFRCNWSLKQHMKSHSQNRPFGCSICGKTFKQRAILKRHFLVHSGLRSFACKICGKAFNHKGNLLRHMAIHDDVPEQVLEKALDDGMTPEDVSEDLPTLDNGEDVDLPDDEEEDEDNIDDAEDDNDSEAMAIVDDDIASTTD